MGVKQKHLNLGLGALALVLLTVFYVGQKKEPPKGAPLTSLKSDAITQVTLHHDKTPDIVLVKKGGDWMLTAPVQAPADALEVHTLTGLAEAETHTALDAKDLKLADLGLDPPGFSVQLDKVQIDFGGTEPLNGQRYVRVKDSGEHLALIDDPPSQAFDADYSDLLSKSLLAPGTELSSIAVPGLTVSRSADGKTLTATPADPKTGTDELQKFVDAWTGAHSMWNSAVPVDVSPGAAPGANADAAVLTLKDGSTIRYTIIAREPQLILERADLKVRYDLAKSDADRLLKLAPPPAPPAEANPQTPGAAPPAAKTAPVPAAVPPAAK